MNIYLIIIGIIIVIYALMNKTLYNFDFNKFAYYLGLSESSNNYDAASNGIGYGRYQFTIDTIETISNELNINSPSVDSFLQDKNLQDAFYYQYVNDILNYIKAKSLDSYFGKTITGRTNGITTNINIYGLVAGAWLSGEGGLYNFLVNGYDANDGRTYVSDYIAKFSQLLNS